MQVEHLLDGNEGFPVSVWQAAGASSVVLFAAGAGGLPERYHTLLQTLADAGCTVLAPHFERLASPFPTQQELLLRARHLALTLDALAPPGVPVVGVGHSIGASTLLAMAGAGMWLGPGNRVPMAEDARLRGLCLLTAPLGFFQAPQALDGVKVPLQVWAGGRDTLTPASQAQWLADTLSASVTVDLRLVEEAGHFSFMDTPPPHAVETVADKAAFLRAFAGDVAQFVRKVCLPAA